MNEVLNIPTRLVTYGTKSTSYKKSRKEKVRYKTNNNNTKYNETPKKKKKSNWKMGKTIKGKKSTKQRKPKRY